MVQYLYPRQTRQNIYVSSISVTYTPKLYIPSNTITILVAYFTVRSISSASLRLRNFSGQREHEPFFPYLHSLLLQSTRKNWLKEVRTSPKVETPFPWFHRTGVKRSLICSLAIGKTLTATNTYHTMSHLTRNLRGLRRNKPVSRKWQAVREVTCK